MRKSAIYQTITLRGRNVIVRLEESVLQSSQWLQGQTNHLPLFAGNKAWKLQHWLRLPESAGVSHFVSHGGLQSNAMLALAQLAHVKRLGFVYYTRTKVGEVRTEHDSVWWGREDSNLKRALALGMQLRPLPPPEYDALFGHDESREAVEGPNGTKEERRRAIVEAEGAIFVPQGAACPQAEEGIRDVALDLNAFERERRQAMTSGPPKPLLVVVPSGTGTTAFYLAQHLSNGISIACVPCVGRAPYLLEQMERLGGGRRTKTPMILEPPPGRYAFAKPSMELYGTWQEIQESSRQADVAFDFDLIYAPRTWQTVFHHGDSLFNNHDLLYLHTGGIEGNPSQLPRYAPFYSTPSS